MAFSSERLRGGFSGVVLDPIDGGHTGAALSRRSGGVRPCAGWPAEQTRLTDSRLARKTLRRKQRKSDSIIIVVGHEIIQATYQHPLLSQHRAWDKERARDIGHKARPMSVTC